MTNRVVLSVVYPSVELYIYEFLSSLSKQTDQNFTLFLLNDGLPGLEIFLKRVNFHFQILEKKGTPAELRKIGIKWAISQGAETIIFADADDYFAENRVEVSRRMLLDYDIVCNELFLTGEGISEPIPMLERFFKDKTEINKENIMTSNCMGLSNTALRVRSISRNFESIPNNIVAFDWALFALCVHEGARAIFTKETQTYYRQHDNNVASLQYFAEKQIMRGVQIKSEHYQFLSQFYQEYVSLAKIFENLFSQLKNDETLRRKYCEAVKMQISGMPLWWAPMKSLKELGL